MQPDETRNAATTPPLNYRKPRPLEYADLDEGEAMTHNDGCTCRTCRAWDAQKPSAATSHGSVPEGQECPTCLRRVPRKPKPSSPQTKVKSIRIPVGDWDEFTDLEVDTAKHLGVYEKNHWQFWVHHYALTLTRQTAQVKDALKRDE